MEGVGCLGILFFWGGVWSFLVERGPVEVQASGVFV